MTTHTGALVSQSRGLRGMVAMTAATVALVGAVAVWQPWGGSEAGGMAPAATGAPPAPSASARSATESTTPVVAVVAWAEAAERLRSALQEHATVREGAEPLPLELQVVVAAAEGDAGRIVAAIDEANRIRFGLGLSAITITDLRHGT